MNEQLLKKHIAAAPRMEPTDAVKLAFQSAFGCGHLLGSPEDCAAGVCRELETVLPDPAMPAYTPIGGGQCRLNLACPQVRRLCPERIASLTLLSAEAPGQPAAFEETLGQLEALAVQGETPFSAEALQEYLAAYRAQGCPPVSHSAAYRRAYAPAYRVVKTALAQLLPLLTVVDERLAARGRAAVVVDGPCAAGKTTLAGYLARLYHTRPLAMDDFFLPPEMRTPQRFSQPGGNVHYERFLSQVLTPLLGGGDFAYNRFDCQTGRMVKKTHMSSPVAIIEGSYSLHPAFAQAYEQLRPVTVWLSIKPDEQLRRLERRDPARLQMFLERWIPLEKCYTEAYHIPMSADLTLQWEGMW